MRLIKYIRKFLGRAPVEKRTEITGTSKENCISATIVELRGLVHNPPYELGELQEIFTILISHLQLKAARLGYRMRSGECYRPMEWAKVMAKRGKGTTKSLHIYKLAKDINLFKDGVYLEKSEDHQELGEYWESLSFPGVECCWGGKFKRKDGNHYSISWGGMK